MEQTRRFFLRQAAATAAGLALLTDATRATLARAAGAPPPRGLLIDAADLPRLRETITHPRFREYWQGMVDADIAADRKFLVSELKYNNQVRHLARARQMAERSALVYLVTGNRAHRDIAVEAIETVLKFPKWDYFLEGGDQVIGLQRAPETTISLCLAREWLDDVLSPALKAEMERQIAEKGAPACYRTLYGLKYPDRVRGWSFDTTTDFELNVDMKRWPLILNATNLKVIPIAGLTLAACLLYDRHPDARKWANMARSSARAFSVMFGTDGCYDEGPGYWGYTASHLTICVEALSRRLGIDDHTLINFEGTSRYGIQMTMPSIARPADCVNFGDAYLLSDVSVAAWTARTYRDPVAQYVSLHAGMVSSNLALFWFDPTVPERAPDASMHDVRFVNDIVVGRTGFDRQSSVVALRSGGPGNHEHADRNSVIFTAYGERLLHDPFKAAYKVAEPGWILRQTSSHTAVLLDGKGHQYHDGSEGTNASLAEARILAFTPGAGMMTVTSDATDAYGLVHANVERVLRTLIFLKPDVLVILDRIRLRAVPRPVQVRFQVENVDGKGSATAGSGTFTILRPLASLAGTVTSRQDVTVQTGIIPLPADVTPHPFVEVRSAPALDHAVLTVCTAAAAGASHGTLVATRVDRLWTVDGTHGGKKIHCTIDSRDDVPVIAL
jgi:hypothetical protein